MLRKLIKRGANTFTVPSETRELEDANRKGKSLGEETERKIFSTDALNLTGIFISTRDFRKRGSGTGDGGASKSKNCSLLFMLGNISNMRISEDASKFVTRSKTNPHVIFVHSKFNNTTLKLWPGLQKFMVLSRQNYYKLESFKCYYISVPTSITRSCSPGDPIILHDVTFDASISRPDLRGRKMNTIKEEEIPWEGKKYEVEVADGRTVTMEVVPNDPKLYFSAAYFKRLPTVSFASTLALFSDKQFLTYFIENPNHVHHSYYDPEVDGEIDLSPDDEASAEGKHVFVADKTYNHPYDVELIPFDPTDEGAESIIRVPGDGFAYRFEPIIVPDSAISTNDETDKLAFECVADKQNPNIKAMAWRFLLRIRQKKYAPGHPEENFSETFGFDTKHAVLKRTITAKINVYKETIRAVFSIHRPVAWKAFMSNYHTQLPAVFVCTMNRKQTDRRMSRATAIADQSKDVCDYSIDYTASGVWIDLRAFIDRIGVPISYETGLKLLREIRSKRDWTGTVDDIGQLAISKRFNMSLLNEVKDLETASKEMSDEDGNPLPPDDKKLYAVILPTMPMSSYVLTRLQTVRTVEEGDMLMDLLHFGAEPNTEIHPTSLIELQTMIKAIGYTGSSDGRMNPLLYLVNPQSETALDGAVDSISQFMGIHLPAAQLLLKKWLSGEEVQVEEDAPPEENGHEAEKMEEVLPDEKHVSFDVDPSQALPSSYEDKDAPEIEMPEDTHEKVNLDPPTPSRREDRYRPSKRSSRHSSSRRSASERVSKRPRKSRGRV